ncbi:MAG: hypothetical protein J6X75_01735 [Clostridia bacterium]|nr:hypothetical protein [Clostridia bacterium]
MSDWRLEGNFENLKNQHFEWKTFVSTKTNDHEHCCFCWIKITDLMMLNEACVRSGYVTTTKCGQENWICERCFNDFKNTFNFNE